MTPRVFGAAALLVAALLPAVASHAQARSTIEDLCRVHGVSQEENISRIKESYVAALDSGISEDELYPFVEEILKHRLDCSQMTRVLSVTTRLRREGLPYFVVLSKVREGVAKAAPPPLIVEAAESKVKTLTDSRDVLKSLESLGYRVSDFQNAAVIIASYLEKGYTAKELLSRIRKKGIEGAGFAALSGVVEKPVKQKER